jgi:dipeptidyl aminopeptidase/acylaminoacyl peptidase
VSDRKRPFTEKDLWSLKFVGDPQISPSGNEIAYVQTVINPQKNLYESSIFLSRRKKSGNFQAPVRFTNGKLKNGITASDKAPRFSPDGKYLAFISNRSGKNQIWLLSMTGGEARQLTGTSESPTNLTWAPDSQSIAFVMKDPKPEEEESDEIRTDKDVTIVERLRYKANGIPGVVDLRRNHIYIVNIHSGLVRQITFGDFDDSSPAFSPDGSMIAFSSCREADAEITLRPDIWITPVTGGQPRKLTSSKGPTTNPVFSPDGKWVAFIGNQNARESINNNEVLCVSVDGGKVKHLWGDLDRSVGNGIGSDCRLDPGSFGPYWSSDSDTLYFILTDKGFSGLYKTSLSKPEVQLVCGATPSEKDLSLPTVMSSFSMWEESPDRITFVVTGETSISPAEIYVIQKSTSSGMTNTRLTSVNTHVLSELNVSKPEHFTFRSSDGLLLDGWRMKPVEFQEGKKYPAIIEIHGGPHSAYGESFCFEFQLLCSKGYGVFFCNPRGSSGYGAQFANAIVGDWGGMDYEDIMSLKKVIHSTEWVDPNNVGVTGGSYGGYLTNWIVGHTDSFKAAVTCRSISNLYSKYGVSDIGWFGNKRGMGGRDLWDSEDFIMERSPIRYAPKVNTPILIIHSEQDYRCPMEQAEQWYVALKRLGKTVGLVRFAGENHELSRSGKPWNRVERLKHMVGWFDRFMK